LESGQGVQDARPLLRGGIGTRTRRRRRSRILGPRSSSRQFSVVGRTEGGRAYRVVAAARADALSGDLSPQSGAPKSQATPSGRTRASHGPRIATSRPAITSHGPNGRL